MGRRKKHHRNKRKTAANNSEDEIDASEIEEQESEQEQGTASESDKEPEPICRYCLGEVNPSKASVVRPCKCKSYLHQGCFRDWSKNAKSDTSKCDACQTPYIIIKDGKRQLNRDQAVKNWTNIFWGIGFMVFLFLPFVWDLKYLINYQNGQELGVLLVIHQEAMVLAFVGTFYVLDGIAEFRWINQKISFEENEWPSLISLHLMMLTPFLKIPNNAYNMFYTFMGITLACAIVICGGGGGITYAIGNDHPTQLAFYSTAITLLLLAVVINGTLGSCWFFSVPTNITKRGKSRLWEIPALWLGQICFHLLGKTMLYVLPDFPGSAWNYLLTQTTYFNVITYAYGVSWFIGSLLVLHWMIHIVYWCGYGLLNCCCPQEHIITLAPYQPPVNGGVEEVV